MNTPKPANGEAMPESAAVPLKTKLLRIIDALAVAKNFNEAVYMACGYMEDNTSKQAIQAVVSALDEKLRHIEQMIKEAQEAA